MPLTMPQKPFRIIPRPEEKEPVWVLVALVIGGILLVVMLVPFFLSRGKVSELEKREKNLDEQVTTLITDNRELSKKLSEIAKRIKDFSTLFRDHRVTSAIFEFLGSLSHPLVQFTDFDFSDKDFRVGLSIKTENFRTLGEQLLILKQNENIKDPQVTGILLDRDGFVTARFEFLLNKKLIMPFSL